MLHLIPAPLHRALYRIAHRLRRRWQRRFCSEIHGCSVIAFDEAGHVLLVRHSYGSAVWAFPGGGISASEDPLEGALREFSEELGCTVSEPRYLGVLDEDFHGMRNVAHIFAGRIEGHPRPDMRELVAARFFALDDLPDDCASTVAPRLGLLRNIEISSART